MRDRQLGGNSVVPLDGQRRRPQADVPGPRRSRRHRRTAAGQHARRCQHRRLLTYSIRANVRLGAPARRIDPAGHVGLRVVGRAGEDERGDVKRHRQPRPRVAEDAQRLPGEVAVEAGPACRLANWAGNARTAPRAGSGSSASSLLPIGAQREGGRCPRTRRPSASRVPSGGGAGAHSATGGARIRPGCVRGRRQSDGPQSRRWHWPWRSRRRRWPGSIRMIARKPGIDPPWPKLRTPSSFQTCSPRPWAPVQGSPARSSTACGSRISASVAGASRSGRCLGAARRHPARQIGSRRPQLAGGGHRAGVVLGLGQQHVGVGMHRETGWRGVPAAASSCVSCRAARAVLRERSASQGIPRSRETSSPSTANPTFV